MISKGANVSAQDEIGRTPLHIAAQYNNVESVQILLYELANPFIKNNIIVCIKDGFILSISS